MSKMGANQSILIYSTNWTYRKGLTSIIAKQRKYNVFECSTMREVIDVLATKQINKLVLDMSIRKSLLFMDVIRCRYPLLPIVVTQRFFYFSDRMVADFFGGISLYNYDSLSIGSVNNILFKDQGATTSKHIVINGRYNPLNMERMDMSSPSIIDMLYNYLRYRLSTEYLTPRTTSIIMDGVAKGMSAKMLGRIFHRSSKVIYHYKYQAMQVLDISHCARDLVPSLSFELGYCPKDR